MRLIDEDGKLIGVMSSFEALNHAKSRYLDLVEIHAGSKPPVCKVMNYGKWKFETKKKEKQNKKNQSKVLIKEIQFRPRTDTADVQIKLNKVREFLNQGHKVKINLRFFGREMAHKELGFKLLKSIEQKLADVAITEISAKMERRILFIILAPQASASIKKSDTKPSLLKTTKDVQVEVVNNKSMVKPEKLDLSTSKQQSLQVAATPKVTIVESATPKVTIIKKS